jgi:uncharacterized membrane protein
MMAKLLRILKHCWLDERDTHRALGRGALTRLEALVHSSEKTHSGEIRLCVEAGLPFSYLWHGRRARERAIVMFGELRVWDTEANNGVLIYLLLADRAIEIVADRGIAHHVPAEHWRSIVAGMGQAFRDGHYEQGLVAAIAAVNAVLARHFPLAQGQANPNELPDRVDLR